MAKQPSTQYTAPLTQFPIASEGSDPLAKEDLFTLQKAVEEHTHDNTRGSPARRINTAAAPGQTGQVQIDGDDLKWWGATAGAVRTAAAIENDQLWEGVQGFTEPLLMTQTTTPPAPGLGLTLVYAKTDGLLYRRSGTGGEVPAGALPAVAFPAKAFDTEGTPGVWAELKQLTLASGTFKNWALAFDGTAQEVADFAVPVPPSYAGTPISFVIQWRTTGTAGNVVFRVDGLSTPTGGDLGAAATVVAAGLPFPAQAVANRKQLSVLPWTAAVPVANDWFQLRFIRLSSDAADTLTGVDAEVLSVTVSF